MNHFKVDRQAGYYELSFFNIHATAYVVHVRTENGTKIKKFNIDGVKR
jgi:hypothetical protein